MFKEALNHHLGSLATPKLVDSVFGSITSGVPAEGTAQKRAINLAYSDILRYITWVAVGTSAVVFIMTLFIPNVRLPDTIDPFGVRADSSEAKKDPDAEAIGSKVSTSL